MSDVIEEDMTEDEIVRAMRLAVKKAGVRWTIQRESIVRTFIRERRHLTAEELYDIVKSDDASVSVATVYRTMNLLVQTGLVAKRHFNEASAAFDLVIGKGHHHHLIDIENDRIIEFNDDELEEIMDRIAKDLGYKISCHKLEIFGQPLKTDD
jgi:Fur family ferric uptake transcriptional regulator